MLKISFSVGQTQKVIFLPPKYKIQHMLYFLESRKFKYKNYVSILKKFLALWPRSCQGGPEHCELKWNGYYFKCLKHT